MIKDLDGAPAARRRSALPGVVSAVVAVAAVVSWFYVAAPRSAAPVAAPRPTDTLVATTTPAPFTATTFDPTTAFQFKLVGCFPGGTQWIFANDQVVLLAQLPGAACLNTRHTSFER